METLCNIVLGSGERRLTNKGKRDKIEGIGG